MIVGSFLMTGSYLLKLVVFYFESQLRSNLRYFFATDFLCKETLNSAQYHEEGFFLQVKNRDDKILPFQRQLSNIALLSAIRLI